LKEKDYVDIDAKYKKTQIAIETHKGASKDLDKSAPSPPSFSLLPGGMSLISPYSVCDHVIDMWGQGLLGSA